MKLNFKNTRRLNMHPKQIYDKKDSDINELNSKFNQARSEYISELNDLRTKYFPIFRNLLVEMSETINQERSIG